MMEEVMSDDFFLRRKFGNSWRPALDITEQGDAYQIAVELPGMKKKDIDISIDDGTLTIAGERTEEEVEHFRQERSTGTFMRRVTLPTTVNGEKVSASYCNGVLTITLPKQEETEPEGIKVKIS